MVDVEQRGLGALEQHRLPRRDRLVQDQRHVAHPRLHPLALRHQLVEHRLPVERRILDRAVARADVLAHLGGQRLAIAQHVADADAAAPDLVLVGRTDAARRRADLALAATRLRQHVELAVVRQDDVRLLADEQASVHRHAGARQLVHFLEQRLRIDHHAVADHARHAGVQDARRDEVQHELPAVHVHRVARRCVRPDSAPRSRSAASACRRSCPCLRRPTVRRARRCWSSPFTSYRMRCAARMPGRRRHASRDSCVAGCQLKNFFKIRLTTSHARFLTSDPSSNEVREHRDGDSSRHSAEYGMTGPRAGFERRVQGALDATPSRIPVVLGGCGTGRTWLLQRLRERAPRGTVQYVDVERCASTPERFLAALTVVVAVSVARRPHARPPAARDAFDTALQFLTTAPAPGGEPCTFLLDEVLELRTFESFPGPPPRAAGAADGADGQPQPVRAHHAVHGPGAPPAARRHGALRGDAHAAAGGRRRGRPAGARAERLRAAAAGGPRRPGPVGPGAGRRPQLLRRRPSAR